MRGKRTPLSNRRQANGIPKELIHVECSFSYSISKEARELSLLSHSASRYFTYTLKQYALNGKFEVKRRPASYALIATFPSQEIADMCELKLIRAAKYFLQAAPSEFENISIPDLKRYCLNFGSEMKPFRTTT